MATNMKVEKLLAKLQKSYNKDGQAQSVMRASEIPPYDVIPTGSLALDYAIGIGGLPTNRVIEIAGEPGSGKTTLVLHTVNNALKKFPNKFVVYLDIENRLTPDWVESFVDDMDRVIVMKPDHMEDATDMMVDAVQTGEICMVVVDSIGGAPSQRVTQKSATIGDIGGNALSVGRFSRFAQTFAGKYNCCIVGINQVRDDMDGYSRLMTPGGKAWKHAVSLRVELKRGKGKVYEKINGEELQVGYSIVAKIHKNSLAAPFRTCSYWFYNIESKYGFGVDRIQEMVSIALLSGVIDNPAQGTYIHRSFPGTDNKIRGQERVNEFIMGSEEAQAMIEEDVLSSLKDGVVGLTGHFSEDDPTGLGDEQVDVSSRK